jgi:haloalkane dehalogenase
MAGDRAHYFRYRQRAMKVLRTPDTCFHNLPGYPFLPHYTEVGEGLRLHYVDEGPREGAPIVMLHGEPSWSYLYRKMIPALAAAGFRALAPDLIGFGRSDKPADPSDYSYERHVTWIREWLHALDLRGATLVCQDWGSLIGLPSRFAPGGRSPPTHRCFRSVVSSRRGA